MRQEVNKHNVLSFVMNWGLGFELAYGIANHNLGLAVIGGTLAVLFNIADQFYLYRNVLRTHF